MILPDDPNKTLVLFNLINDTEVQGYLSDYQISCLVDKFNEKKCTRYDAPSGEIIIDFSQVLYISITKEG